MRVCMGRQPAVHDPRIPSFAAVHGTLPPPPDNENWWALVNDWGMLANNKLGCCVDAFVLHAILQFSTYAGKPLIPTDDEAIKLYEENTGYNPADPSTDQGSYVMGPSGIMQYWKTHGVMCGGVLNKVGAFMTVNKSNPTEWRQAIHYFGGCGFGINLPENVVSSPDIPFVWDDPTGVIAGGHEVWAVGFETVGSYRVYDLISWGQRYRATEEFLLGVTEEVVTMLDPVEMNARGVNAADLDQKQLDAAMAALKAIDRQSTKV